MDGDEHRLATAEVVEALGARVNALTEQVAHLADSLASVGKRAADLIDEARAETAKLATDLAETTHDLAAVATLMGHQAGEPFRAQAAEIIAKRQTGG